MSINNNTPVPVSLSIGAFPVNNVGGTLSTASGKALSSRVVNQTNNKLVNATQPLILQTVPASVKSTTAMSTGGVTVAVAQKQGIPTGASIITIAPPSRTTIAPLSKMTYSVGKHQLPVRLSNTSITHAHVVTRLTSAAVTTVSTTSADPGGGCISKTVVGQPTLLPVPPTVKPTKGPQHILMAPGLRSPAPSLKLQTYPSAPTYSYHLSNQPEVTSSVASSKCGTVVSTSRLHSQSLLVRSIAPTQPTRTLVPLAMATTPDARFTPRANSVVYQPTSTISISIPARTIQQSDSLSSNTSSRATTSSLAGKSSFHIGISQASISTPTAIPLNSSAKSSRMIVPGPSSTMTTSSRSQLNSSTSAVISGATAFTYSAARHASVATITTSAIPVAKIFPQQPQGRVQALQPLVTGMSAHTRTSEYLQPITASRSQLSVAVTTTQAPVSIASVVTSVAIPRSQPLNHPPLMFWQHSSALNLTPALYSPQTASSFGGSTIRPALNPAVSNPAALAGAQIQINQPGLFGLDPAVRVPNSNVAAFTQGQLLHTVSTTTAGKDSSRSQSHPSTTLPSAAPQHVTHSSPKPPPTILRRQLRTTENITKKLVFDTRAGISSPMKSEHRPSSENDAIQPAKARFGATELLYIKPELSGQAAFTKPIATSNGLTPLSKMQGHLKDYSSSAYSPSQGVPKHLPQSGRHPQQNVSDIKVKTEPGFQHMHFKTDTGVGGYSPPKFYAPYLPINKPPDRVQHVADQRSSVHSSNRQLPNKVHQASSQPANMSPRSHSNHLPSGGAGVVRQVVSGSSQSKDFKIETNNLLASSALKRDYSKMNSSESLRSIHQDPSKLTHQNSLSSADTVGLSPRKKPRKQTHVVAEELPDADQIVDDEMSTDDADECEDEVPLPTSAQNHLNAAPAKSVTKTLVETTTSETKPPSSEGITPMEYTDDEGVRYIAEKKRPPITLLNGHRMRPVSNHFTHYSDVKVKEKKTTLHDVSFNEQYLRGWKVVQFASQLEDLVTLDSDILTRIEAIKEGLLHHNRSVLTNSAHKVGCLSPGYLKESTSPSSTSSSSSAQSLCLLSYSKGFSSCLGDNGMLDSSLTPAERKAFRFRDDILKVEDMAQANIQRCNVIREQLTEAKNLMLKILDQRSVALKIVQVGREANKSGKNSGNNGARGSKKKKG